MSEVMKIDPLSRMPFAPRVPWQRFESAANRIRWHRMRRTEAARERSERDAQIKAMAGAIGALREQVTKAGLKPCA